MLESKIAWISTIETRDDALEVAKIASFAFFFLAALQLVLFKVLDSTGALISAVAMVAGAVAVLFLHSRSAAATLLGLSGIEALLTLANLFGAHVGGRGSNILVAGLMVWVSVRAVQATWALERMPDDDD
jgi:hypothetical protein